VREATIAVDGLRKRYGATTALDGMTFEVRAGEVTGFVGPNGAGKSTTMRVILGLDRADAGTALVEGRPYGSIERPLRHVGSLLDASALQPSRTAANHLLWLAYSQGLPKQRVAEVLEQTGLKSVAHKRAGGFSLGMRQRLGIAAALLGDPGTIMLDEPFNGMDPEGIIWMRSFLKELAAGGRAVLVSSHLMAELQDAAHHVIVVGRGRVIADASVADLLANAADGRVVVRTSAAEAADALRGAGGDVTAVERDVLSVRNLAAERIVAVLTEHRLRFAEVSAHRATLEEAYIELTKDAVEYRAGEAAR
jgi:ABC-2 type transport system ATP-binding protein